MQYRETGRFDAAVFAAIVLVTLGAILGDGALFAAAAVPIAYLAVGGLTRSPSVSSLTVERTLEPELPAPGERTTVTLTVRNDGERTLPDVRVVDWTPDTVPLSQGSTRGCLSLRSGEAATITYEVVPRQGDHGFDAPIVRLRPLSAVGTVTGEPSVDGVTTLRCRRSVGEIPQNRGSLRRVGTQPTDAPGPGTEFHSIREYRSGDDISRIEWRSLAKTGELSTVNFRETRATKAVVIVDGSPAARQSRDPGYPTGAELSAYAADRICDGLLGAGDRIGLTALGIGESAVDVTLPSDRDGRPWVPVGNDPATRTRIDAVLDAVVDAAQTEQRSERPVSDGGSSRADPIAIRERLPPRADVVIVTPLLESGPIELIESLAVSHSVLVVSPNVTDDETPGRTTERVERRLRIGRLRAGGATVIDWETEAPLSAALEVPA